MTLIQRRATPRPQRNASDVGSKVVAYLIIAIMCFFTFVPFYFMFIFGTWDKSEIFTLPPHIAPGPDLASNYSVLMGKINFWRSFWNSLYIAVLSTVLTVFFCALGGFAFAMYDFKFKNVLFSMVLGSLLIPSLMGIIPFYLIMQAIGWVGEPKALYIPGIANAFGVFLMRQYITSAIPKELVEAARIDGCSEIRTFWSVVFPLLGPATATLALTTFIGQWNNIVGPLIVLKDRDTFTLPLALRSLQGMSTAETGAMMVGVCIAVVPLLIVFAFTSRNLIAGLAAGAVKG